MSFLVLDGTVEGVLCCVLTAFDDDKRKKAGNNSNFWGHTIKKEKLENLAATGEIEEKRSRGRQRGVFVENL